MHEYGGGQSIPVGNRGETITSDFASNALVSTISEYGTARKNATITTSDKPYRYADMSLDHKTAEERGQSGRLMFAVREDHSVDVPSAVVNSIVVLTMNDSSQVLLDFISCPYFQILLVTYVAYFQNIRRAM